MIYYLLIYIFIMSLTSHPSHQQQQQQQQQQRPPTMRTSSSATTQPSYHTRPSSGHSLISCHQRNGAALRHPCSCSTVSSLTFPVLLRIRCFLCFPSKVEC